MRTDRVIQHEIDVTRHQLMRNDVELIAAAASFVAPDAVRLDYVDGATSRTVTAKRSYEGGRLVLRYDCRVRQLRGPDNNGKHG